MGWGSTQWSLPTSSPRPDSLAPKDLKEPEVKAYAKILSWRVTYWCAVLTGSSMVGFFRHSDLHPPPVLHIHTHTHVPQQCLSSPPHSQRQTLSNNQLKFSENMCWGWGEDNGVFSIHGRRGEAAPSCRVHWCPPKHLRAGRPGPRWYSRVQTPPLLRAAHSTTGHLQLFTFSSWQPLTYNGRWGVDMSLQTSPWDKRSNWHGTRVEKQ